MDSYGIYFEDIAVNVRTRAVRDGVLLAPEVVNAGPTVPAPSTTNNLVVGVVTAVAPTTTTPTEITTDGTTTDAGSSSSANASTTSAEYEDVYTATEQNVVPALSKPYRAGPGAFGNAIIGAQTLTNGHGVQFIDGSTQVFFYPNLAGFNLNINDVIVLQYSI